MEADTITRESQIQTMAHKMADYYLGLVEGGMKPQQARDEMFRSSCAGSAVVIEVVKLLHKAPAAVRKGTFGCVNCLWASSECIYGSNYQPKDETGCAAYTYYD